MNHINPKRTSDGLLTCARYALAPNMLGYCGPDRNRDLAGYIKDDFSDRGLSEILNDFETLSPYLKLIGSENRISNIFRPDVVKAYWLGNKLLARVKKPVLYSHIDKNYSRRMDRINIHKFRNMKIAYPNHNFHVLTIFVRSGHKMGSHTLDTINKCRISWGKIISANYDINKPESGINYKVRLNDIVIKDNCLRWGEARENICTSYSGKYQIGDIVSLHWDQICDRLTVREQEDLMLYTNLALSQANDSGLVNNL